MMRLSAGKVAIILSKVRSAGLAEEATDLESHLETVGSEDLLLSHLQAMTESTTRSALAEQATAAVLESWKPIIMKSADALAKFADVEERRMKLEEREFDERKAETGLKYQHVIAPIVAAFAGILSTIAAFYFATN